MKRAQPVRVGNAMRSVTSELSGRGNIQLQARRLGLDLDNDAARQVLAQIKHLEHEGFTFEAAEASVELMFHRRITRCAYSRAPPAPPPTPAC